MIKELDVVVLRRNLPEHRLQAGDLGTVMMVHNGGAGFEVEFTTLVGETLAVVTLSAGDLRPTSPGEIAHARRVA
jgi:hypothetical protein